MARAVVPIRLSTVEQASIDTAAEKAGLTRAAYIRMAALTHASGGKAKTTRAGAVCRHQLASCRVCQTGSYRPGVR